MTQPIAADLNSRPAILLFADKRMVANDFVVVHDERRQVVYVIAVTRSDGRCGKIAPTS